MRRPELYIIHGWTYTVEPWKRTLELLKNAGINVKMLHVPGLTEESSKVYTIDDYVKWADENIPDGAIALGHSNGGRILLNLSIKKPGKLSNLILLDAAGIYEVTKKKKAVAALAKLGKPFKKIKIIDKAFHRLTGTTDYSRAPENMKKTLANMIESDKNLKFEDVKVKTYIMWGKNDSITPPRHAEIMHSKIEGSELKVFANWTHAPYISNPDELAKAIVSLMARILK